MGTRVSNPITADQFHVFFDVVDIFKIHNTKTSFHDARNIFWCSFLFSCHPGDPGAISRDDTIFVVKAYYGRFRFSQNFRNFRFGGKWNTFRRLVPLENSQKIEKSKKVGPFFRLEFPNGISCPIYTFLGVNCASFRSTARKSVTAS